MESVSDIVLLVVGCRTSPRQRHRLIIGSKARRRHQ